MNSKNILVTEYTVYYCFTPLFNCTHILIIKLEIENKNNYMYIDIQQIHCSMKYNKTNSLIVIIN